MPGLDGAAVEGQGLDAVGVVRARELLALALDALDDGHRHPLLGEPAVALVEDRQRLRLGLLVGRVGGVALLPEELGGAQEQAGAHLPAHDVGPLVDEQRQVAVALDPLGVGVPDDRLARRADDQLLLQLGLGIDDHAAAVGVVLQAVVGDDGALLGEALDVVGLLRLRNDFGMKSGK